MSNKLDYIKAVLYNFLKIFGLYTAACAYESAKLVYFISGGDVDG